MRALSSIAAQGLRGAVCIAALSAASCGNFYCSDPVVVGFMWEFDTALADWDIAEGGEGMGEATEVVAFCRDGVGNQASCSAVALSFVAPDDEARWSVRMLWLINAGSPPELHITAQPDCRLCCDRHDVPSGGFVPNNRPGSANVIAWTERVTETTINLEYDVEIAIPAIDPSSLVDFPECPVSTTSVRAAGRVIGRRVTLTERSCS